MRRRARRAASRTRRVMAARMCSGESSKICLRGVEPQAVEVVFVDPVGGVGEEELAHRAPIRRRRN